jgi:hypothetical protein
VIWSVPLFTVIVLELASVAPAGGLIVRRRAAATPTVSIPWFVSAALRARSPAVPSGASIVPVAALVNVPFGTVSVAPYDDVTSVRTIAPLLVQLPPVTASTAPPNIPFPSTRIVEVVPVATAPLT